MLAHPAQMLYIEPGTGLIATGLAALISSAVVPSLPIVSAMALVAAGATVALCSRLGESPYAVMALLVHLFVYLSLYLIFIGAALHSAMRAPHSRIDLLLMLDFGASAVVIAFAVRQAIATLFCATSS